MTGWASIAERAEAASGPDRAIEDALFDLDQALIEEALDGFHAEAMFTGSMDVARALICVGMPGTSYQVVESGFGGSWAKLWDPKRQPGHGADYPRADAKTAPLALVAALARAKAAEGDGR